jgi:AmmeMemoRadiSam system protein A
VLDLRNTGDTTGDKSRGVVGYAAIAFYEPGSGVGTAAAPKPTVRSKRTAEQQKFLLELARRSVNEAVRFERILEVDSAEIPEELQESWGCFVTLNKDGRLRGCVGDIFPRRYLYQAVVYSAAYAAVRDRRFKPVGPEELDEIEIEISLLSLPTRQEFKSPEELLDKLRPGIDGVVLRVGRRQATYLPHVWKQLPRKQEFLERLAEKAGLERSEWRNPEARILLYQAEVFHEKSEK